MPKLGHLENAAAARFGHGSGNFVRLNVLVENGARRKSYAIEVKPGMSLLEAMSSLPLSMRMAMHEKFGKWVTEIDGTSERNGFGWQFYIRDGLPYVTDGKEVVFLGLENIKVERDMTINWKYEYYIEDIDARKVNKDFGNRTNFRGKHAEDPTVPDPAVGKIFTPEFEVWSEEKLPEEVSIANARRSFVSEKRVNIVSESIYGTKGPGVPVQMKNGDVVIFELLPRTDGRKNTEFLAGSLMNSALKPKSITIIQTQTKKVMSNGQPFQLATIKTEIRPLFTKKFISLLSLAKTRLQKYLRPIINRVRQEATKLKMKVYVLLEKLPRVKEQIKKKMMVFVERISNTLGKLTKIENLQKTFTLIKTEASKFWIGMKRAVRIRFEMLTGFYRNGIGRLLSIEALLKAKGLLQSNHSLNLLLPLSLMVLFLIGAAMLAGHA